MFSIRYFDKLFREIEYYVFRIHSTSESFDWDWHSEQPIGGLAKSIAVSPKKEHLLVSGRSYFSGSGLARPRLFNQPASESANQSAFLPARPSLVRPCGACLRLILELLRLAHCAILGSLSRACERATVTRGRRMLLYKTHLSPRTVYLAFDQRVLLSLPTGIPPKSCVTTT